MVPPRVKLMLNKQLSDVMIRTGHVKPQLKVLHGPPANLPPHARRGRGLGGGAADARARGLATACVVGATWESGCFTAV